jgi:hypothetical protein
MPVATTRDGTRPYFEESGAGEPLLLLATLSIIAAGMQFARTLLLAIELSYMTTGVPAGATRRRRPHHTRAAGSRTMPLRSSMRRASAERT